MADIQITNGVTSVGVLNPNMRVFDIVMPTEYGSSYNSYLVEGERSAALIETVHLDFFDEYLENLRRAIDLNKIEYLIMNHNEPDHSGSVERLAGLLPNLKIVVSQAGSLYLKNITNRSDLNLIIAKDGESLDLGGKTLRFISAPFLHWPDSMFTWLPEEKVLFSCDFLGAHFCEPTMLDTHLPERYRDGYFSAMVGYYGAIFGPFKPYVRKGLEKIQGLDIQYAATSHGPVLTKGGMLEKVMDYYRETSQPVVHEQPLIPVFYTSAYHNTEKLALAIARGIKEVLPQAEVTAYDLVYADPAETARLINECDGCMIGSPTINRDAVPPIWALLSHVDAVNFAKRPVGLFGSYGWSGEGVPNLRARLEGLKARLMPEDFRVVFVPTEADLEKARAFGRSFAEQIKG